MSIPSNKISVTDSLGNVVYPWIIIDGIKYSDEEDVSVGKGALYKYLNDDYSIESSDPSSSNQRKLINTTEQADYKSILDSSITLMDSSLVKDVSNLSTIKYGLNRVRTKIGTANENVSDVSTLFTSIDNKIVDADSLMEVVGIGSNIDNKSVVSLYNMPYGCNTIDASISDVSVISFNIPTTEEAAANALIGRVYTIYVRPSVDFIQVLPSGISQINSIIYHYQSSETEYVVKKDEGYTLTLTVYDVNIEGEYPEIYINIDVTKNELSSSKTYYKTFSIDSSTYRQRYQQASDSPLYIGNVDTSLVATLPNHNYIPVSSQVCMDITGKYQYCLKYYLVSESYYELNLYASSDFGQTFTSTIVLNENHITPFDIACSKNGKCVYITTSTNKLYSNYSYGVGTFTSKTNFKSVFFREDMWEHCRYQYTDIGSYETSYRICRNENPEMQYPFYEYLYYDPSSNDGSVCYKNNNSLYRIGTVNTVCSCSKFIEGHNLVVDYSGKNVGIFGSDSSNNFYYLYSFNYGKDFLISKLVDSVYMIDSNNNKYYFNGTPNDTYDWRGEDVEINIYTTGNPKVDDNTYNNMELSEDFEDGSISSLSTPFCIYSNSASWNNKIIYFFGPNNKSVQILNYTIQDDSTNTYNYPTYDISTINDASFSSMRTDPDIVTSYDGSRVNAIVGNTKSGATFTSGQTIKIRDGSCAITSWGWDVSTNLAKYSTEVKILSDAYLTNWINVLVFNTTNIHKTYFYSNDNTIYDSSLSFVSSLGIRRDNISASQI